VTVLDSYPYQNAARILLQMDADPARHRRLHLADGGGHRGAPLAGR
jgi:hypothetical protein